MFSDGNPVAGEAVPGLWFPAHDAAAERRSEAAPTEVARDGMRWSLGTTASVAWLMAGTTVGTTVTSAIPAVFDAYATIALPEDLDHQERHDEAILSVLTAHSPASGRWWLGYLDTGADDVVFADAPRVTIYSGWPYVLVLAGPEQAATWRTWDRGASYWSGRLPNMMFAADRSWLVSTLWDDDWTCIGGSAALVEDMLRHPDLRSRSRRVEPDENATPSGHQAS